MAHEGWGDGWADVPVSKPGERGKAPRKSRPRLSKRERRRRIIKYSLCAFAALIAVVALFGALLVRDAMRARGALEQAADLIPGLEQQLRSDPDAAVADLAQVQSQARIAASATRGPHWSLAARLPFIGDDIRAFRQITSAVDDLAQKVLPSVSTIAMSITPESLAPVDGRINLAPLIEHRDEIVSVDETISGAIESVRSIRRVGIISQVADAADTLQEQLEQIQGLSATAARAAVLLPPMLGADGPRNWLVLAQNNAEPRATGGIPGAILLLRADDGAVSIEDKATGHDFGRINPPIARLTEGEEALFGELLVRFSQNLTMTPDFPRTGELARRLWQSRRGEEISGVMSIDPVGLAYFLRATGPVVLPIPISDEALEALGDEAVFDEGEDAIGDGRPLEEFTLTSDNIAGFLMNETYLRYENPDIHDYVFSDVAEVVFGALLEPGTDPSAALDALIATADAGRLMVWSPDEAEQERLVGTVLSGELRGYHEQVDGTVSPLVGVFQNLTLAGKQGYYIRTEVSVGESVMRANDSQEFSITISLTNTMDPATAAYLPHYVIGNTDGTIRTNVLIYAPTGGAVLHVADAYGDELSFGSALHDGLHVGVLTAVVAPGATETFEIRLRSGAGQSGPVDLRLTPGASGD